MRLMSFINFTCLGSPVGNDTPFACKLHHWTGQNQPIFDPPLYIAVTSE